MNDDDLSPRAELASAFLDGELEADQRVAAQADPDVVASIEAYRQIRAAVGDAPPASDTARSTALAAAMAEFDSRQANAPGHADSPVLSMLHRRRTLRVQHRLIGLAAAAVIVVVGVAAIAGGRNNDHQSSSSATAAPEPSTGSAERNKAASAATEAPGVLSIASAPPVDTPAALKAYAASQPTFAADSAAGGQAAPGPNAATQAAPATAGPSCGGADQIVLGEITVLGAPAYALRNSVTGELQAVDAADCHVLFSVAP